MPRPKGSTNKSTEKQTKVSKSAKTSTSKAGNTAASRGRGRPRAGSKV